MLNSRLIPAVLGFAVFFGLSPVKANEPDPKVMTYQLPDHIKWTGGGNGPLTAVLAGDPSKPGIYVVLTKWPAHHMSHPHFHPNDRYIYVISGTWWVGWGSKYDPDSTFPMPKGTYVRHIGGQIHYDGAKDEDAVLEIVGMGPATSTPAEKK